MCSVSMIYDYGRQVWPTPTVTPPPVVINPPPTYEQWQAFLELVEKARQFDEITGQADCEDPEKAEWAKGIEDRLKALEESNA
jgi:hypothetical protein